MSEWTHKEPNQWRRYVDHICMTIIQDETTYDYTLTVSTANEGVIQRGVFKSKVKAIKAADKWVKDYLLSLKQKEQDNLFAKTCDANCECPKCSDECGEETNIKITTTKTTRKEKLEDSNEPGRNELKIALWYIEKIGGTKRAKEVLAAACSAMDQIKGKRKKAS